MIYFKFQVEHILKSKDDQIDLLKSENARLRLALEIESGRANAAVDRLLNQVKVHGVTVEPQRKKLVSEDELLRNVKAAVMVGRDIVEKE